jgi:energy-coupling factor transporter ATP-binding protein EcfA2
MAEVASSAEDRAAVLRDPENLRAETAATLASVSAYTRAELDPSQPMIALEGVSYSYEGESEPVLRDLSLTVRSGEFVLILGPSGCGKSTLLNLLNGSAPHLIHGTLTGGARVCGKPVAETKVVEIRNRSRHGVPGSRRRHRLRRRPTRCVCPAARCPFRRSGRRSHRKLVPTGVGTGARSGGGVASRVSRRNAFETKRYVMPLLVGSLRRASTIVMSMEARVRRLPHSHLRGVAANERVRRIGVHLHGRRRRRWYAALLLGYVHSVYIFSPA